MDRCTCDVIIYRCYYDRKLMLSFSTHGLPNTIVSDNGPCFTAHELEQFVKTNGVRHITTSPWHPASNGLAERAVQTVKMESDVWKVETSSRR